MPHRSVWFRAFNACFCGWLAAVAIDATALCLHHADDATVMLIVWQLGSVALLSALAGAVARIRLALSGNRLTPARSLLPCWFVRIAV